MSPRPSSSGYRGRSRGSRRAGFSLVEMLVVTVIGTVTLLAIYQSLAVQERTTEQQKSVVAAQQISRTALAVLTAELRELSATGGDLIGADSFSITYRNYRKVGVVCARDQPNGWVDVWKLGESFVGGSYPAGDSIYIFADNDPNSSADDAWNLGAVSSTGSAGSGNCPAWQSYGTQRLHVGGASLTNVNAGALIRSFRNVTYGLYQVAGEWVLGRQEDAGSVVALIGPLEAQTNGGLLFRYFDSAGTELVAPIATAADRTRVARIAVRVRARSGIADGTRLATDSLTAHVALRGNDLD